MSPLSPIYQRGVELLNSIEKSKVRQSARSADDQPTKRYVNDLLTHACAETESRFFAGIRPRGESDIPI
jgi:hypothetical protein